jgi:hypothetical protein
MIIVNQDTQQRFDVPMVVKMLIVFWVVMACSIVGSYQCFRGTYQDCMASQPRRPQLKRYPNFFSCVMIAFISAEVRKYGKQHFTLKMEVIHTSETLVTTYKNAQHHYNPEDTIDISVDMADRPREFSDI